LKFENVATTESNLAQVRQSTANTATTRAFNRSWVHRVHGDTDFNRQTAALAANKLEWRQLARCGQIFKAHWRIPLMTESLAKSKSVGSMTSISDSEVSEEFADYPMRLIALQVIRASSAIKDTVMEGPK